VTQEGRDRPQTFDPIGRQVGVTARAMRVLLDGALATAGSTFADWTVLAALTNGIDPRDLETTLRVLAQIADRARSLRTSGQASR
jgi:hypothetical protein